MDLSKKCQALISDFNHDIASMSISMDKIVLDQHIKEGFCS